jgi:site-specific recombinase XerD
MREAAQLDTGTSDSATIALYGAAIEILISTAIRVKNLTNLKIRENLIMPNDPRGQAIVWVPGEDVKNGNTIEVRLSQSGTKLMRRYLEDFRPNISEAPSGWLFPNRAGQRRNIVGFSAAISDVIYRQTGLEMHSHLFRHFALKMLERERPGSAEIGRRLLGHCNIQTTLNSYAENRGDAAHQQFENVIDTNRAHLRLDLGPRS